MNRSARGVAIVETGKVLAFPGGLTVVAVAALGVLGIVLVLYFLVVLPLFWGLAADVTFATTVSVLALGLAVLYFRWATK